MTVRILGRWVPFGVRRVAGEHDVSGFYLVLVVQEGVYPGADVWVSEGWFLREGEDFLFALVYVSKEEVDEVLVLLEAELSVLDGEEGVYVSDGGVYDGGGERLLSRRDEEEGRRALPCPAGSAGETCVKELA